MWNHVWKCNPLPLEQSLWLAFERIVHITCRGRTNEGSATSNQTARNARNAGCSNISRVEWRKIQYLCCWISLQIRNSTGLWSQSPHSAGENRRIWRCCVSIWPAVRFLRRLQFLAFSNRNDNALNFKVYLFKLPVCLHQVLLNVSIPFEQKFPWF